MSHYSMSALEGWTRHVRVNRGIPHNGEHAWTPTDDPREIVRRALAIRDHAGDAAFFANEGNRIAIAFAESKAQEVGL